MTVVAIWQLAQNKVLQFFLRIIGGAQRWSYPVASMTVVS